MASIKIFEIVLNGVDCEKFCKMDIPTKIEFIQKHSQQKDEAKIRTFLKLPPKQFIVGCCGFVQSVKPKDNGGNISNTVQQEITDVDQASTSQPDVSGDQRGRDNVAGVESKRTAGGKAAKRKANRNLPKS